MVVIFGPPATAVRLGLTIVRQVVQKLGILLPLRQMEQNLLRPFMKGIFGLLLIVVRIGQNIWVLVRRRYGMVLLHLIMEKNLWRVNIMAIFGQVSIPNSLLVQPFFCFWIIQYDRSKIISLLYNVWSYFSSPSN